jgi:hypothetical protein
MLGQDKAVCFAENLDRKVLLAKINDIWSNRDMIKKELKTQTEFTKEQAMINGELLKKLLDPRSKELKKVD